MKTGQKETTRQKYMDVLNEIHLALNYNPNADLLRICTVHKANNLIPTYLRRMGVIVMLPHGNKWNDNNLTKPQIIERLYEMKRESNEQSKLKRFKGQLTIEPIEYTQKDLNAWKSNVNKQKSEQSELPIQQPEQKRGFELKLFGLTIIKINR
jgi:virulence-associated protein VagC